MLLALDIDSVIGERLMRAVEMLMQGLMKTEDRGTIHLLPKSSSESAPGAQLTRNQRTEAVRRVAEPRFSHPIQQNSETAVTDSASKFFPVAIFIDRVAGEIIRLVASVCPSVCLWVLSCLNRLTFVRDFWREGRPRPWLAWGCRSRSNSENCLCFPI